MFYTIQPSKCKSDDISNGNVTYRVQLSLKLRVSLPGRSLGF